MFGKALATEFSPYRLALYASTWLPAALMDRLRRARRA
jgi:hypothetical protein